MEKTERNRDRNHDLNPNEAENREKEGQDHDWAFWEFRRVVENRLENAILERMEAFKRELINIKRAKK